MGRTKLIGNQLGLHVVYIPHVFPQEEELNFLLPNNTQCLSDMEVIRPFPLDPWQLSICELISSCGSALNDLHEANCARLWLFTSVSVRNGFVRRGLVVRVNQVDIATSSHTVGSDDVLNAHYAQLGAVLEASLYVRQMLHRIQVSPWKIQTIFVVSNPTILQSLAKLHLQRGQALITQVTDAITLSRTGMG